MRRISEIKKIINKSFLIAAGATSCFLTQMPSMANQANNITTFSGNVAGTCTFNGLADDISMLNFPHPRDIGSNVLRGHDYFSLTSNGNARISASFSVIEEPEAFIPGAQRDVQISEEVNYTFLSTSLPGVQTNSIAIPGTPGTSKEIIRLQMIVNPANTPGQYRYVTTVSCLL